MPKATDAMWTRGTAAIRRAASLTTVGGASLPEPVFGGGPYELVESEYGPLWMLTSDEVMRPYMRRRRAWEESTTALLRRLLRPGARFLDVGANVGYFSVFAHRLDIGVEVDAVEPHPVLHRLLQANLWANGVPARMHNTALGDIRSVLPMSSAPTNPGDTRIAAHTPDDRYDLLVPVVTADELFARRTFDVVKIDVQGYEPEVVLGMERIVRASPAIVLVVQFRPASFEERGLEPAAVLDRYHSMGFHIAVNDDGGTGTCTADDVIDHCRSAGPEGQVHLMLRRST